MCTLREYDLDQSIGKMLPKLPVIVHHILKQKEEKKNLKIFLQKLSKVIHNRLIEGEFYKTENFHRILPTIGLILNKSFS